MFLKSFTSKITETKTRNFLFSIFFVALFIRIAIVVALGEFHNPQMWEHGTVARNLLAGHGYSFHWHFEPIDPVRQAIWAAPPSYEGAFLPPLNPYMLYWTLRIFGDAPAGYVTFMLINSLLSALSVIAVYKIAKLLSSTEFQARISAGISALFLPGAVAVTSFSGSPGYQLIALIVLYFCITSSRTPSFKNFAILGILCGILVLARSEFLILSFILIGTSALYAAFKNKSKNSLINGLVSLILCASVVAPWTYRNYKLFDKFVPVVTHPWFEIWRGYHDQATGGTLNTLGRTSWVYPDLHRELIMRIDSIPYDQQFEVKADLVFKEDVFRVVKADPARAIYLTFKKAIMLWTVEPGYKFALNPVYLLSNFFVLIVFFTGFIHFWRSTRDYSVINPYMLFLLYYTAIFAITLPLPRYQIYILSTIMPFTGIGIDILLKKLFKTDFSESSNTPLIQNQ